MVDGVGGTHWRTAGDATAEEELIPVPIIMEVCLQRREEAE